MLRLPVPAFEDDTRGLVNTLMALRFLWVGTAVCVIGAVASAFEPFQISVGARAVLVGAQGVLALLCAAATRLVHRLPARLLVLWAGWACVATASLAAVSLGHGAHSLDLSFFPLVICVVAVLVGTGSAFAMTLACAAIVVALALAEGNGWLAGAASLAATPLSHPLTTHGLLLLAGFTVGVIMLRLSNASYRTAEERETRWRNLLAVAHVHEAALRRSESMLSTVFATTPDCLALTELATGRFLMVNQAFVDIFGYTREEAIGRTSAELGTWASPAERERLLAALREHGKVIGMRVTFRKRSGEAISMLISAALCRVDDTDTIVVNARDLSADDRTRQDLATARDAAEAASRAKSAFLANTSHEIRTPLNGLLGLARLAMRDGLDEAQRKAYVAHILESAEGLSATMSDILDLSKIEAGRLDIEVAPFRLRGALEAVRHSHLSVAEAKGLALQLHVDAALPEVVSGDATRVRQVLGNFVSNAIKFTERGIVQIRVTPQPDGRIHFAVTDSGIGIDPTTQQRLFEPFSQADQSTTRRFGGTGLGLSICRELARLMGGSVGVRSTPGEGSEFWADLSLAAADGAALQASGDREAEHLRTLRGARVLVGEDNAVNMMITLALLEQWGVQAVPATDGEAVVEAVQQAERDSAPFDAVLMDVQMPRLSGHAAARALRERFAERTPPIIALTAAALVSEREEALRAGMCDFLTKPVNAERMRSVLADCIVRARAA